MIMTLELLEETPNDRRNLKDITGLNHIFPQLIYLWSFVPLCCRTPPIGTSLTQPPPPVGRGRVLKVQVGNDSARASRIRSALFALKRLPHHTPKVAIRRSRLRYTWCVCAACSWFPSVDPGIISSDITIPLVPCSTQAMSPLAASVQSFSHRRQRNPTSAVGLSAERELGRRAGGSRCRPKSSNQPSPKVKKTTAQEEQALNS